MMHKRSIITGLMVMLCPLISFADIIVKKDGSTMEVYNIEVGTKYITFTKASSPDSELGRVLRDECFAVKTDDGEMKAIDTFNQNATQNEKKAENEAQSSGSDHKTQKVVNSTPAADNQKIIDSYNSTHFEYQEKDKEEPNKIHDGLSLVVWGIGQESVMSDDNILIAIEPENQLEAKYKISIKNKTESSLYLDLTNSFRIDSEDSATPFFDNSVYSTNLGKGAGGSLNLGAVTGALGMGGAVGTLASGMNIGGGTTSSTSVSKSDQPILIIPPHSKVYLPFQKEAKKDKVIELPEIFYYSPKNTPLNYNVIVNTFWTNRTLKKDNNPIYANDLELPKNGVVVFNIQNTPKTYKFIISYSLDQDFMTVNRANFNLFLRDVYGFAPVGAGFSSFYKKGLKEFIEQAPNEFIWGFGEFPKIDGKSANSKSAGRALMKGIGGL
ncbi:MAG: hypothetical protein NC411_08545 [Bacteroides sp.]|nr:hypothetical protein [Bacteroides sp.]